MTQEDIHDWALTRQIVKSIIDNGKIYYHDTTPEEEEIETGEGLIWNFANSEFILFYFGTTEVHPISTATGQEIWKLIYSKDVIIASLLLDAHSHAFYMMTDTDYKRKSETGLKEMWSMLKASIDMNVTIDNEKIHSDSFSWLSFHEWITVSAILAETEEEQSAMINMMWSDDDFPMEITCKVQNHLNLV